MIDRYTIKFGPAVSQKELEKALHTPTLRDFVECDDCRKKPGSPELCADCLRRRSELEKAINQPQAIPDLKKMKARIEFIGDFDDVKKVVEFVKQLGKK
jgi:hypothetical protein